MKPFAVRVLVLSALLALYAVSPAAGVAALGLGFGVALWQRHAGRDHSRSANVTSV